MTADGDVEALLHEIDETIGHMQREQKLWIAHCEFAEMRRQRELCRRHRGCQPHRAAWLAQPCADDVFCILRFDDTGACMLEEIAAEFAQRKAARRAVDQPR